MKSIAKKRKAWAQIKKRLEKVKDNYDQQELIEKRDMIWGLGHAENSLKKDLEKMEKSCGEKMGHTVREYKRNLPNLIREYNVIAKQIRVDLEDLQSRANKSTTYSDVNAARTNSESADLDA